MHRRLLSALAAVVCLALPAAAAPHVWKTTPAPPPSWESDRTADLSARRRAVLEQLGEKGILILYAAEPRNYAGDVDWPYRQENDFFYLTGLSQAGSALVLIPSAQRVREILFLPPSNPAQENWTGHILTPEEGRRISGIRDIWDARRLNAFLAALMPSAEAFLPPPPPPSTRGGAPPEALPIPVDVASEFARPIAGLAQKEAQLYLLSQKSAEYVREHEFAGKLTGEGFKVQDAAPLFAKLRRVKSPREVALLQHAAAITAEAFQRAFAVAVPGAWEYEIQAQFEFTFLRRNAHWGYPCIVASGVNATTLHYETNQDRMKDGDLLLMDDAAEFGGYSVDVTRTIPVNGKFTPDQAIIYRLVWDAQQAAIRNARSGRTITGGADSVTGAANQVFRAGLLKLGLITDVTSDQQLRLWFNHGISHGIGLNVHDPGAPELQPGMAITVEPGLYFRPDALDNLPKTPENEKFIAAVRPAFERFKGIGVRIEDDLLITTAGPQVLSADVPSRLEEVEASLAQLRKALKSTPLP